MDHFTTLNILLENPEELDLKHKPSAIREDKIFTLDHRVIPIASAEADDNGAYLSKGNAKRFYQYSSASGSRTVHSENGVFFANVKASKGYRKEYVPKEEVYELARHYKTNKANPSFSRAIITVRAVTEREPKPWYLVLYKWTGGPKTFILQRHGNAMKPTASAYFRKDPVVSETIDEYLAQGLSVDKIYGTMSKEVCQSVSETISGPKMIENRKFQQKAHKETRDTAGEHSEVESLISSLKSIPSITTVSFTKRQYSCVNIPEHVLDDVNRFCVLGNSILHVDTTFELVDGLWLTDTTFSHEALINHRNGKHPEFPGPSFWHFKKDRETYRRFAGELAIAKPELLKIKKIGHDLDKAIAKGMTDIFQDAQNVWCTQHMKERDAQKVKAMGGDERTQRRIMADIYGCQEQILLENGLADSEDPADYEAKLASLKDVWEGLVPGFHDWFDKHRSEQFKTCLINSARQQLGLSGRFYTNGLELKHKLQKKRLRESEVPKEVAKVTDTLEGWTKEFYAEEERALRGLGKYRLAPGYEHFLVDPVTWNKWGPQRQAQHFLSFRRFIPKSYNTYKKPSVAGLKEGAQNNTRRCNLPEPELFVNRTEPEPQVVTPLRIYKGASNNQWEVILTIFPFLFLFQSVSI